MERPINTKGEVDEPMNVEGSFEGQINSERKNNVGSNVQELGNKLDGGEDTGISRDDSKDNKILTGLLEGQTSPNIEATENVNAVNNCGEDKELTDKTIFAPAKLPLMVEDDDGTPEEQATFIKELESFLQERAMNFNPQEVNGKPLNFLKLWRCVIRLGGYDRVTGYKLWWQLGELFFPSKTCVTISWACQTLYEKYVLEYERHKTQSGELQLPEVMPRGPETSGVDREGNGHQGSGSDRTRRDSDSHSTQGSHAHHLGLGESSIKQKSPNDGNHLIKAARTETSKQKPTVPVVINVGPSADWVKINIQETSNFYKVYGLVPGLSPEEIRVQSDPAGRLVIFGQPKRSKVRWGVASFRKIVIFPARINPRKTFAFVSMYGRLWIRAPFEQPKKSS
ncbi:AT-rich interactive domain-containing protein 5-like [Henckelia pumila]|uniref:AT-rich interactive domain-containing protein 5-like n=1 Tax=Henckelia pumila TaxID=405737 RepID=UPI003C6E5528